MRFLNRPLPLPWTCSKVLSHGTWNSAGGSDDGRAPAGERPAGEVEKPHSRFPAAHPPPFTGSDRQPSNQARPFPAALCASRTQSTSRTETNFGFLLYPASSCHNPQPRHPPSTLQRQCLLCPGPQEARRPQTALLRRGTGKTR